MCRGIVFTIVALLPVIACGNLPRGAVCATPNEEISTCEPVTSCKVIINSAKAGNRSFVQESQCGHDGIPLVCCGSVGYISPDIARISPLLPEREQCGLSKREYRVVGGELTAIDEFPWMALLRYKKTVDGSDDGFKCGGSLISKRYVMTAAHCVLSGYKMFEVESVRLGEWNTSNTKDCETGLVNEECADPVVDVRVELSIPHPEYTRKGKNDIALLRLVRDVPRFTNFIRAVCLPQPDSPVPPDATVLTVAGWGVTENDTRSDVKLKLGVPLVSNSICAEKFPDKNITETQLCAGGDRGKDSCRGDSGGPLMVKFSKQAVNDKSKWYQEGIVSFGGNKCGVKGYPAIYTRVSKYVNWIIDNMRES